MPALEVADIFRRHGEAYRRAHAGHLSRTDRRVMGAIEACRTAALSGHVERFRAECGLVRIAYNCAAVSALPEMSGIGACRLAGREADRAAAGAVFPRRLHAARAGRRDRLPEQGGGLRHPVQGRGRDAAHDRRRSQASRRRDRLRRRAPHLGSEPAAQATPPKG